MIWFLSTNHSMKVSALPLTLEIFLALLSHTLPFNLPLLQRGGFLLWNHSQISLLLIHKASSHLAPIPLRQKEGRAGGSPWPGDAMGRPACCSLRSALGRRLHKDGSATLWGSGWGLAHAAVLQILRTLSRLISWRALILMWHWGNAKPVSWAQRWRTREGC